MPRPPVWPPKIHVRHGRAVIRVRGTDYYLGAPGSPEAKAEYARLIVQLASGQALEEAPTPPDRILIDAIIVRWLRHAGQHYSDRGRELVQHRLAMRPLRRLFGTTQATAFRVAQLEQLQLAMATGSWLTPDEREQARERRRPIGWCRNVCHRRITRVLTMMRWAEKHDLIPEGRHAHLLTRSPLPRGGKAVRETEDRQPCSFSQVKAAARKAPPPVTAMLLLQWWTGMRSGEVRIVRPCDVDRSGPVWLYRPSQHKTEHLGQPRVVPLGSKAQAVLRRWLDSAPTPESYAFRPLAARRRSGDGPVTYRDSCYTPFSYSQAVRRACGAAGVEPFQPYQCRHAARQRLGQQLGDNVARQVLGQVSMEATSRYARKTDLAAAIEAMRRIG